MAEYSGADFGFLEAKFRRECVECPVKKTPEECLLELRELLHARPDLEICDDDSFMMRFLLARKLNVEASFQLCVNYCLYRRRNPEVFDRLNALNVIIQQALRDGFPFVLPDRDRKGHRVLVLLASRWNHSCYSLQDIYRALLLSLDHLIADPINQLRGFVVIADWTEFSFKNSLIFNPKVLKTMIEGLQDCFPARIKGVHFVGQPWYVEAALTLIKPFLKEKSRDKIRLHGNNLGNLHEWVPVDVLPPELGGDGPRLDSAAWTQQLIDEAHDHYESGSEPHPTQLPSPSTARVETTL